MTMDMQVVCYSIYLFYGLQKGILSVQKMSEEFVCTMNVNKWGALYLQNECELHHVHEAQCIMHAVPDKNECMHKEML